MKTLLKILTILSAVVLTSVFGLSPASAHHDDSQGSNIVYEGAGGK